MEHTQIRAQRAVHLSRLVIAAALALLLHTCRFCGLFSVWFERTQTVFSALSSSLGSGAHAVEALSASYRALTDAAD